MTRVLIDGRALYEGNRFRGAGSYIWALLGELAGIDGLEVAALVTEGTELPAGVAPALVRRRYLHTRLSEREHRRELPGDIARHRPDVYHSPWLDPPRECAVPWVQSLLDVIPLTFDHPWFNHRPARWRRRFDGMERANAVITPSAFSASEGVRVLGLEASRVHVAPLGIDDVFSPGPGPAGAEPYLLYVGVYGPNKGYRDAFALAAEVARRGHPHRLKVVGNLATWWVDLEVRRLLSLSPGAAHVDLLGAVPFERLLELYRGASALVVTSRAEGFGFPALEAMACGTPVVSFANSSLAEVVDHGGLLVRDGDVGAMADAVAAILSAPARAAELRTSGRAHAATFTWKRCAGIHADVFREVAAGRPVVG